MWNDREEGRRFKLYHQLYLLSGQVWDESLVKDRQTRHANPYTRTILYIISTAAPAPGGATCILVLCYIALVLLLRNSTTELKTLSLFLG